MSTVVKVRIRTNLLVIFALKMAVPGGAYNAHGVAAPWGGDTMLMVCLPRGGGGYNAHGVVSRILLVY